MASENPSLEPAGASNRLRLYVRLLFIGVFVILAALLAVSLLYHRQAALENGDLRARGLALILSNHLARTAGGIETTLSQLALLGSRVGGPKADDNVWAAALEATRSGVAGVSVLAVIDESGIVTHATSPGIVGQSRADVGLFQRLSREPIDSVVADAPRRARSTGEWVIPFARRLVGTDGKFSGLVVATLQPERLRDFYKTINVGPNGLIWVIQPGTAVLLREPATAGVAGEPALDNPIFRPPGDGPATRAVRAPVESGGPMYISAVRASSNPPLSVGVSLAEGDLLTQWSLDALISTGIMAAFGVLLLFAWRLINREILARTGVEARIAAQATQLAAAVSRHEEADAALRANQAQFQSLMDHAPVMVSLKDLSGRFTFINRAYVEFLGKREEDILGRTIEELQTKEIGERATAQDRAVLESRRSEQLEIILPTPDGPRTTLLAKFPVYDDTGNMASIGTVLTDLTEQKRIETQLAQAQRIEAIGQLSGGIAHDFNNLLTSILLNADVLASVLDVKLRPLAEAIRMAAERGADLTRRLLAFGRRQMLEPRPTDVKDLLTGMEPLMHRTLGEHIEVQLRHAADLWSATVDPGQLENAVLNLAVNARDAMPGGGRLTIETANVELDAGQAAAYPETKAGQFVMVAVHDTGSGMPTEVVARAFEPFFTTKDVGKGTGLGLSMVYGFVKQSGGHARIDSEVSVGTVVRIYLPRSAVAAAEPIAAPPPTPEAPTGKETILFVEDDPMVRQHTGRQIVGLGYTVLVAENGAEALALVENGSVPDLLFTDVVMPGGMNGRQLALRLRERWPSLRVLYTSGYAHGALTIDGEQVPTKYVLGKPYRRRDLAAKLREVLDEPSA